MYKLCYLTTIIAMSCRLIFHMNVAQSADCPHVWWSSDRKWQTTVATR